MAVTETIVFVHLKDGPAPAGRLTMTEEPRNSYATFAYGRRYLERPDRVPVDPVALPLHDPRDVEHRADLEERLSRGSRAAAYRRPASRLTSMGLLQRDLPSALSIVRLDARTTPNLSRTLSKAENHASKHRSIRCLDLRSRSCQAGYSPTSTGQMASPDRLHRPCPGRPGRRGRGASRLFGD